MDGVTAEQAPPWHRDALRNLAIVACGFGVYALSYLILTRIYPGASWRQHGIENSLHIVGFERALGVLDEGVLQSFVTSRPLLLHTVNAIYLWLNVPLIAIVAVWLFTFRRQQFRITRNAMLVCGGVALICEFFPTAPPYLTPGLHVVNTVGSSKMTNIAEPQMFYNVYGAVPSIHVAWSLLIGVALWRTAGPRWLRLAGFALPLAMALVVVATGNHYIFDVATGVLTALVGLWLGGRLQQRWQSRNRRMSETAQAGTF